MFVGTGRETSSVDQLFSSEDIRELALEPRAALLVVLHNDTDD